jgi:PAS domain S-box-containing protein
MRRVLVAAAPPNRGRDMMTSLFNVFDRAFMPHGHCFFWRPEILWMHVGADALTAAAYFLIPFSLVRIVRKRQDLEFDWVFLLFSLFILFCGLTHVMGIVVLWEPFYRAEGWLKVATAMASVPTAFLLMRLTPRIVDFPSIAQLRRTEEELRQANEKLQGQVSESEQQYRLLAESLPQMIWRSNPRGEPIFVNRRWIEFTGLSLAESQGNGWHEVVHPEDRERVLKAHALGTAGCEAWEVEYRLRHVTDGDYRWQLARCEPVCAADGRVASWVGSITDIHERRCLEESLRAREEQLRTLTDAMPQLVWSTRADGYHDFFNRAWYEYTGVRPGGTDGEGWAHVLHPDDRERTLAVWHRSLETGEPYEIEYRFRQASTGRYRWFIGRANAQRDSQGQIVRWMGTCTDIHDQRMSAEQLARANEDLEHFAYAASHDLQEPLRTILLYGQLLQQRYSTGLEEQGRAAVASIVNGATRLMALLSDLRSFLRVGRAPQSDKPLISLNQAVDAVLAGLEVARQEAHAEITRDALPDAYIDESHFSQILQNLVSNALRYRGGKPARVHIGFIAKPRAFFVQDYGEGIPGEYQEKIFQAFRRLHGQRVSGSGLGLAICARIVALYGGRLWVESSPGEGSTFFFTLPDAFRTPALPVTAA